MNAAYKRSPKEGVKEEREKMGPEEIAWLMHGDKREWWPWAPVEELVTDMRPLVVSFDLEATGLRPGSRIVQISAFHPTSKNRANRSHLAQQECFNRYVLPDDVETMEDTAAEKTGLRIMRTDADSQPRLFDDRSGHPLATVDEAQAIAEMIAWLRAHAEEHGVVLMSHGAALLDVPRLLEAVHQHRLEKDFYSIVVGWCDSLAVFQSKVRELRERERQGGQSGERLFPKGMGLEALCAQLLEEDESDQSNNNDLDVDPQGSELSDGHRAVQKSSDAHRADADAQRLYRVICKYFEVNEVSLVKVPELARCTFSGDCLRLYAMWRRRWYETHWEPLWELMENMPPRQPRRPDTNNSRGRRHDNCPGGRRLENNRPGFSRTGGNRSVETRIFENSSGILWNGGNSFGLARMRFTGGRSQPNPDLFVPLSCNPNRPGLKPIPFIRPRAILHNSHRFSNSLYDGNRPGGSSSHMGVNLPQAVHQSSYGSEVRDAEIGGPYSRKLNTNHHGNRSVKPKHQDIKSSNHNHETQNLNTNSHHAQSSNTKCNDFKQTDAICHDIKQADANHHDVKQSDTIHQDVKQSDAIPPDTKESNATSQDDELSDSSHHDDNHQNIDKLKNIPLVDPSSDADLPNDKSDDNQQNDENAEKHRVARRRKILVKCILSAGLNVSSLEALWRSGGRRAVVTRIRQMKEKCEGYLTDTSSMCAAEVGDCVVAAFGEAPVREKVSGEDAELSVCGSSQGTKTQKGNRGAPR